MTDKRAGYGLVAGSGSSDVVSAHRSARRGKLKNSGRLFPMWLLRSTDPPTLLSICAGSEQAIPRCWNLLVLGIFRVPRLGARQAQEIEPETTRVLTS